MWFSRGFPWILYSETDQPDFSGSWTISGQVGKLDQCSSTSATFRWVDFNSQNPPACSWTEVEERSTKPSS